MHLRKFIFYIFIFFSFESIASGDNKNLCTKSNGLWRVFNHSCFDKCSKIADKNMPCYRLLEYGCDCGDNKCWQDNQCVAIKIIKSKKYKIYHGQKPKIQNTKPEDTSRKSDFFSNILESIEDKETISCKKAGGVIKNFRNNCADNCDIKRNAICTQVITKACDCGPNQCWDKVKCIKNDSR